MAMLDELRERIVRREYELSKHALDQSIVRDIGVAEIEEAISNGAELIEDYPDDKYGPSCLLLGLSNAGRPLHLQCSYPGRSLVKIITLYEPNPDLWVDFRTRKPD
jgi:hypothetical protein